MTGEMSNPEDITRILQDWGKGRDGAQERLFLAVYDELRRVARQYLRRESADQTLQPTELVHEAYMRLVDQTRVTWQNRAHFFGIAAQQMRRILVDRARARKAGKRGGDVSLLIFDDSHAAPQGQPTVDLLALDEALERLAQVDERKARVVEMRFFAGLKEEEIAECLNVSTKTVERDWQMAKLWLYSELASPSASNPR
jgi:RNA polymerase sigma factor (TIGR02999 family)